MENNERKLHTKGGGRWVNVVIGTESNWSARIFSHSTTCVAHHPHLVHRAVRNSKKLNEGIHTMIFKSYARWLVSQQPSLTHDDRNYLLRYLSLPTFAPTSWTTLWSSSNSFKSFFDRQAIIPLFRNLPNRSRHLVCTRCCTNMYPVI